MRLLRHKKGQLEIIGRQLIEVILAFIVAVAAISYAYAVGSNLRIMEAKSARDLALTIETMQGSQGNVLFSFADAFGFQYKFGKNRVDVYLKDEPTEANSLNYYLFPQDSQIQFIFPEKVIAPGEEGRTVVVLKKSFPHFFFSSADLSFSSSACEKIDTSNDQKNVLVLFSGKDESLKKTVQEALVPSIKALAIGCSFYEKAEDLRNAAKASPNSIILEISDSSESEVKISALGERNARSLSCLIKNLLTEKGILATVLGTSAEDNPNLINPASLKIEVGQSLPYKNIMESLSEGIREYLK